MLSNKRAIVVGLVCLAVLAGQMALAEDKYAGNMAKTENENVQWKKNIEAWSEKVKIWNEKRMVSHGDDFDNYTREYCSEKGCWNESLSYFSFTKNGSRDRLDLKNSRSSAEIIDREGNTWEDSNSGQSLSYTDLNGKIWESRNFGQTKI